MQTAELFDRSFESSEIEMTPRCKHGAQKIETETQYLKDAKEREIAIAEFYREKAIKRFN